MTERKKRKLKLLAAGILLFGGNLVLCLTIWFIQKYDDIHLDQLLFQMRTPTSGAEHSLLNSAAFRVGAPTVVLTILGILGYRLLTGRCGSLAARHDWYARWCGRGKKVSRFVQKHVIPTTLSFLIVMLGVFTVRLDVFGYVNTVSTESDFIREHYVDPNTVELKFPQQKRNLIYIFLESMETTFADALSENYIPELTELAEQNVSFSNTESVGGALPYMGTTWTAAAMASQTSGVMLKVPVFGESYQQDTFLPGVVSIGELLERAGYHQTLLLGSDADFANRSEYFTTNGHYDILDINALKKAGRLPEDYQEWWGYEDEKLFSFAKEEITRLAAEDAPFNFTMLTADTHFPDGYVCRLCRHDSKDDNQYGNVLHCSSRQVAAFVRWIQAQPFYENTTIVISGDHLTMDPDFLENLDPEYQRTTYNCFINAPIAPVQEKNRQFGSFDMYPTTLAALGVTFSGDRLALGANLFSDTQTLTERYGFEMLNMELQKKSQYYQVALLGLR